MGNLSRKQVLALLGGALTSLAFAGLSGCSGGEPGVAENSDTEAGTPSGGFPYTMDTPIDNVRSDATFGSWGRLLFPVDKGFMSGNTLGALNLTWYSCIDPNKTVEICNYLHDQAASGAQVFYDIYSDDEKAANPDKGDTGLFFFQGEKDAPFAIWSAGGGFAYVAAMHDSFPHALELSKRGYNAFAVVYRPGAQTACEDLSRAISFVFDHAEELGVSTDGYLLGGGSAGARMSAWVGGYGTAAFGEPGHPQPIAVVTQYTGLSEWQESDPATFANVGTSDPIANWRVMQERTDEMSSAGIPTEFHVYQGLRHGFGLGTGTEAEGWINQAVAFWEAQR